MWLVMAKYIESKKEESAFLYFKVPVSLRKKFDHIDDLDTKLHMTILLIPDGIKLKHDRQCIIDSVKETCMKHPPIKCSFEEIGLMGNDTQSLVLNVNAIGAAQLYSDLIESIEKRWQKFDRKYDFLPHVTLKIENDEDNISLDDLKKISWTSDKIYIDFNHGEEEHIFSLKGD